jgi:hypothetical protein
MDYINLSLNANDVRLKVLDNGDGTQTLMTFTEEALGDVYNFIDLALKTNDIKLRVHDNGDGTFSLVTINEGSSGDVDWTTILNKPETFPPDTHTHEYSTLESIPTTFTPSEHTHDYTAIQNKPATFTPSTHTHSYGSLTSIPTSFNPSTHSHAYNTLTGIPTSFPPSNHSHSYTYLTDVPTSFTPSTHTHTYAQITGTPPSTGVVIVPNATLYLPFDGAKPSFSNFTVNTTDYYGRTPVTSTGIIGGPGKFGKAVQIAEATTNLIDNPSFELATWSGYNSPITNIRYTNSWSFYGDYINEIRSGQYSGIQKVIHLTPGNYTFSFYYFLNSGTTIRAKIQEIAGAETSVNGTKVTGRAHFTFTVATEGDYTIIIENTSTSTITWYVDAIQLENKAYVTPYCDGSLGEGHSWSGDPHASTSSRVASDLSYDNIYNGTYWGYGAISGWFKLSDLSRKTFLFGSSTLYGVGAYYENGYLYVGYTINTGTHFSESKQYSVTLAENQWFHLFMNKPREYYDVYVNGVNKGGSFVYPSLPQYSTYKLGSDALNNFLLNGWVDDFFVSDGCLTATEISSMYSSGYIVRG